MQIAQKPHRWPTVIFVLSMLPCAGVASRAAAYHAVNAFYFQQSTAGVPLGKLHVPPAAMASRCTTMVSPHYPQQGLGEGPKSYEVIVRVVIWKSGMVSPMRLVSGQPQLEMEAMNAVRLWRYRPFSREGEPVDVTTDVRVDFDPNKPGGLVTHPTQ